MLQCRRALSDQTPVWPKGAGTAEVGVCLAISGPLCQVPQENTEAQRGTLPYPVA